MRSLCHHTRTLNPRSAMSGCSLVSAAWSIEIQGQVLLFEASGRGHCEITQRPELKYYEAMFTALPWAPLAEMQCLLEITRGITYTTMLIRALKMGHGVLALEDPSFLRLV